MKIKFGWVLCLSFSILLLLLGCASPASPGREQGKLSVVASFYPVYDVARNISGDKAEVSALVPAGVEPHDYEPSPAQVIGLSKADVFVVLGIGLEGIEDKLITSLGANVAIIRATEGMQVQFTNQTAEGEELPSLQKDPHVWVSPIRMVAMAQNVKEGMKRADPKNSAYYEDNARAYVAGLEKLDLEYKKGLSGCKQDTILVTHRAFTYLAVDYNFRQLSIGGLSPETEPTSKELAKLVDVAKEHNLKYVFYEELVDPRVAQTIATDVGAQVLELNPAEGSKNPSDNYFTIMRRNLANLKLALECA